MIRENRAVPILMVITIAWVLYLAGCFGSEEPNLAVETPESVTPVATSTPEPVVTQAAGAAISASEDPFIHTIEQGDLLTTIAATYNVPTDVIVRANPNLDPNVLIVGAQLRIPGATTDNSAFESREEARAAGEPIDYVVASGDNMGLIAEAWTVSLTALLEANPDVAPEALQIGQLLVIPPYGTGLSPDQLAALSTPEPVERTPGEPLEVTVEPGDSLSEYATLYSVTVNEIMAANGLEDPNAISVGDLLLIPPPSQTPVPSGN